MQEEPIQFEDDRLGVAFAADLIELGVRPEYASLFCQVKGFLGHEQISLRKVHANLTSEGVRRAVLNIQAQQLVRYKLSGRYQHLKRELNKLIGLLASEAPNTEEAIQKALALRGVHLRHPFSVFRSAELLELESGLRLESWRGLSKHYNRGSMPESKADASRMVSYDALVPSSSPMIFEPFIAHARRLSRSMGAISARQAAESYTQERGLPVSEQDAVAMLTPFCIQLGRHKGDDWFVFFSSSNSFVAKTASLVTALGKTSFQGACEQYARMNRSVFASGEQAPESVLRLTLEVFGFSVAGDLVSMEEKLKPSIQSRPSPISLQMIQIFRELVASGKGKRGGVSRPLLLDAFRAAGLNDVTIFVYLGHRGIFKSEDGVCYLLDGARKSVKRKTQTTPVDPSSIAGPLARDAVLAQAAEH